MRRSPLSIVQITTAAVVACAMTFPASADLLVYTGFDYGQPGLTGGSSPNDIGWAGAWTGQNLGLDGISLPYPDGIALTEQPGKVSQGSANSARRQLAVTLDLTSNDTWYFSYLSSSGATGSATNIVLQAGTTDKWAFDFGGSTYQGQVASWGGTGGYTRSFDGVNKVAGAVYMFVFKLEANGANAATGSMTVYRVGVDTVPGSEPVVWGVTHTENVANTVTLNHLRIQGANFTFDEFRMGTTWESVTIPEPASLALLGLGGLMMLCRSSRRSRV